MLNQYWLINRLDERLQAIDEAISAAEILPPGDWAQNSHQLTISSFRVLYFVLYRRFPI